MKSDLSHIPSVAKQSKLPETILKGLPFFVFLFFVFVFGFIILIPGLNFVTSIILSLITVVVLIGLIANSRKSQICSQYLKSYDLLKGLNLDFDYYQVNGLSAIGIDLTTKKVGIVTKVQSGTLTGVYDFDDINSVSSEKAGYSQILEHPHSNKQGLIDASDEFRWNQKQKEDAGRRTGLKIALKDIQKADIFVVLPPAHLDKWYRLFEELFEGRDVPRPQAPILLPCD